MLKKLLAWAMVLVIAALLAAPAFAISAGAGGMVADTDSPTGPFTADDCVTLQENPDVWAMNVSMFPGLESLCPSP